LRLALALVGLSGTLSREGIRGTCQQKTRLKGGFSILKAYPA